MLWGFYRLLQGRKYRIRSAGFWEGRADPVTLGEQATQTGNGNTVPKMSLWMKNQEVNFRHLWTNEEAIIIWGRLEKWKQRKRIFHFNITENVWWYVVRTAQNPFTSFTWKENSFLPIQYIYQRESFSFSCLLGVAFLCHRLVLLIKIFFLEVQFPDII